MNQYHPIQRKAGLIGIQPLNLFVLLLLIVLLVACTSPQNPDPKPIEDASEELSGGATTVFDVSENAFGFPARNLSEPRRSEFFVGNSFFNQNWVGSPASTTARDGLGPLFNARSCSGCHFKDGRGRPPEAGEEMLSMLLRLSIPGEGDNGAPKPEPRYGGQLQNFAVQGAMPEGVPRVSYEELAGTFADGEAYSLRKPTYRIDNLAYDALHPQTLISPRVAPQMIGMGLLEAISETDVLANADERDANNDGISGRPNYVWNAQERRAGLGRFGWKANQPTILQQTAGAFNGDIGITTRMFPAHGHSPVQSALDTLPNGGLPEIADSTLAKVALYSRTLAVPARRGLNDARVIRGKQIFQTSRCQACHVQSFTTSVFAEVAELSRQKIYPFTDLLLHDMGADLADNRPDFRASGTEWRTPPLWGIGLFRAVNKHTYYLHDGRARNLSEAILWHGGEAAKSRDAFKAASKADREALLFFLLSL
jgi:CxxC motif-containing protein (DUF1111 family)